MTLPSKSGGFQLPKIEAVSSQIRVESPDSTYFDWALTQYIQKVRWVILRDDIIYELASIKPRSINDINNMRSISNGLKLKEDIKQEIIDNVLIGINLNDKDLPNLPKKRKLPYGTNSRVSLLKILLNSVSEKLSASSKDKLENLSL